MWDDLHYETRAEFWRARALLIGQYKDEPERLADMIQATAFAKAQSLDEWADLSLDYPSAPLPPGDTSKAENRDVPVRAFILKQAILGLFQLSNAPAAMRQDLEQLLDSFLDNPAEVRANVQALRLDYPDLKWVEICDLACADYRQVMRDKSEAAIVHNPRRGPTPA